MKKVIFGFFVCWSAHVYSSQEMTNLLLLVMIHQKINNSEIQLFRPAERQNYSFMQDFGMTLNPVIGLSDAAVSFQDKKIAQRKYTLQDSKNRKKVTDKKNKYVQRQSKNVSHR